jgi:hypothetical protein
MMLTLKEKGAAATAPCNRRLQTIATALSHIVGRRSSLIGGAI